MARGALGAEQQDGRVRVDYPVEAPSLFDRSWSTVALDEVHLLRTGNATFRAVDGLWNLANLKMGLSATPLVEGLTVSLSCPSHRNCCDSSLQDILTLAKLLRPPMLGAVQQAQLADRIRLVTRTKNHMRVRRAEQVKNFMNATSTDSVQPENDTSPIDVISAGVMQKIQALLMRHTLRRTGNSKDHEGRPITLSLPPLTVLHAVITLTDSEVQQAALFEQSEEARPDATRKKLEIQRPAQHNVGCVVALGCGCCSFT